MFITFRGISAFARAVFTVYLLIGAAEDIRKRSVSVRYLAAGGGLAVLLTVILYTGSAGLAPEAVRPGTGAGGRLIGLICGLVCVMISRVKPESIGPADGALTAMIGLVEGCYRAAFCLLIAFALTALFGIVTGVIGGYGLRGRPLPFIPFLAAGYAAGGFIWPG
ncbi:MAG: prepilin peptidase [Lachnospiraceae bacterium]|nr:prepilin peptidase [Lachnospiraceae bacterium]